VEQVLAVSELSAEERRRHEPELAASDEAAEESRFDAKLTASARAASTAE
jgi:hypothetical protein